MIYQLGTVVVGAILVLAVPATRTELRNTYEAPLQTWPVTFREWVPDADFIPADIPTPRMYAAGPRKRLVPAGAGKLAAARTGPLAWIWADLDPHEFPLRRMADGRLLYR